MQRLLTGVKRITFSQPTTNCRLPITLKLMQILENGLHGLGKIANVGQLMLWWAFIKAVSGAFPMSEYAPWSMSSFELANTLIPSEIMLESSMTSDQSQGSASTTCKATLFVDRLCEGKFSLWICAVLFKRSRGCRIETSFSAIKRIFDIIKRMSKQNIAVQ